MKIRVSKKDISDGVKSSAFGCPIALALKRLTGDEWSIVDVATLEVGRHEYVRELPPEAVSFVHKFDAGKAVQPFSFHLDVESVPPPGKR